MWYNCSRSLKFNICGPEKKLRIYVENGLFPQFFRHDIKQCTHFVGKICHIKYYVK